VTATKRQIVYLDNSTAPLLRIVFDRVTDNRQGTETGFVRYRGCDVAVWRPGNPRCLGLDRSWQDGHWRNIYDATTTIARGNADHLFQRGQISVGGVEVKLPATSVRPTQAIQRFVRQHLR
jgi:chaperone required for assembly of F1-ATPase